MKDDSAYARAREQWKLHQRRERRLSIGASLAIFVGIPASILILGWLLVIWPWTMLVAFPVVGLIAITWNVIDAIRGVPPVRMRPRDMPDEPMPDGVAQFPEPDRPGHEQ